MQQQRDKPCGRKVSAFGILLPLALLLLVALLPEAAYALSFGEGVHYPAAANPVRIGSGDLNGDGYLDLAVANFGASGSVSVLYGNGNGQFTFDQSYSVSDFPNTVAIGNFNADVDSLPDLAVTSGCEPLPCFGTVSILLADGSGGFNQPTDFFTDEGPSAIAVGNFDASADPGSFADLAIPNLGTQDVSILFGDGAGSFSGYHTSQGIGAAGFSIAAGNFNPDVDAFEDLAVRTDGGVSLLFGDGSGSFPTRTQIPLDTQPVALNAGDFNSDSRADLAVRGACVSISQSDCSNGSLSILIGSGDGSFSQPNTYTTPPAATGFSTAVTEGDFNGDGRSDLAMTSPDGNRGISIFLGDGQGEFTGPANFAEGSGSSGPGWIVAGNFNSDEDNLSDLAFVSGTGAPMVRLNTGIGYARPKGATPTNIRLVPAYEECASANAAHGAPFSTGSCNPPVPASQFLTVGTPDANGKAAGSSGSVTLKAIPDDPLTPGDDADLSVQVSITDVRNQDDLTDYTGELGLRIARQITDRDYAPLDSGTTAGDALFVPVSCMPTSGSAGSTCATSTTANTIQPGLVKSGKRAIWDLGAIEVLDGGSNGVAGAPDATVFEQQGFFAP